MSKLFKRKEDLSDLEMYDEFDSLDDLVDDAEDIDYDDLEATKEFNFLEEDDYDVPTIIESYVDEDTMSFNDNQEENKESKKSKKKKSKKQNKIKEDKKEDSKYKLYKRIINIVFTIIMLATFAIFIDVIAVSRYNVGPFFAIKTKTYNDGGSKVYYGLGYKVIKYHQVQGRRDSELGFWSLPYNTEPIDIQDIDLAIEFESAKEETSKKYYGRFLRLQSTVKKVDEKNNTLVLTYNDEGGKYTLDIYCSMADKKSNITKFSKNQKVNIIGTEKKFKMKDSKNPNRLYINNCFAGERD